MTGYFHAIFKGYASFSETENRGSVWGEEDVGLMGHMTSWLVDKHIDLNEVQKIEMEEHSMEPEHDRDFTIEHLRLV